VNPEDAGQRLDLCLTHQFGTLSRSRIHKVIDGGGALVNGVVQKSSYMVRTDDQIQFTLPEPEPAKPVAQELPVNIVYEDDHIFVINKAAGMVVHPGAGARDGTLVNALLWHNLSLSGIGGVMRPGIVHRLDKETSGLMLVAKNDQAHTTLSAALSRREVHRLYNTIALREFAADTGTVNAPIGRHPSLRLRMEVREELGKPAITYWRVMERFHGFTLLECRLGTGRTHQIRVHLSHIHHPVLGDPMYGGGTTVALQLVPPRQDELRTVVRQVRRQMLHARELAFTHPCTGQEMRFESPLPPDFKEVLDALRRTKASTNPDGAHRQ
jgi:23S rRNA pseudouridine1911/1915/1917 synthase